MDRRRHWQRVWSEKSPTGVSWYSPRLDLSLELIRAAAPPPASVVDVGGGASTLVDDLVRLGYGPIAVLDVAGEALEIARARLGASAREVDWIVADVVDAPLPVAAWDAWHDRAVFHFLLDPAERAAYAERLAACVRPGGHAVVATFADDGPDRCSGLEVARYDERSLARELSAGFVMRRAVRHVHVTPRGVPQSFLYGLFQREDGPAG